ncbi:MAG: ArnT family glycosyltransferase [Candidatus Promineifilaceae bacterium]
MSKIAQYSLLALILVIAATLRFAHLDWDEYRHYHPDERYISWVATSVDWPQDWHSAFVPHRSTINPYYWPDEASSPGIVLEQGESRNYAYGHLPLYMGVLAAEAMERLGGLLEPLIPSGWEVAQDLLNLSELTEFSHITVVGRALTAFVDLLSVALVFILGRAMYGPAVGLLAAAFLAVSVMHVQLAHFFTVDPFLTFFALAAVTAQVMAIESAPHARRSIGLVVISAALIGLAIGSKSTAFLLFVPLIATLWLLRWLPGRTWTLTVLATPVVAFTTFVITNPFALIDFTCQAITPAFHLGPIHVPALNWGSCFLQNVVSQGAMVRGVRDVPYVRQYAGTVPYLYFIEMQLRWGMGLLLGLVAFGGFAWAISRALLGFWRERRSGLQAVVARVGAKEIVVLAWTVPYFLATGGLDVKFMRYMQPLSPFLMIYGAAMLLSLSPAWLRRMATVAVLVGTSLYALAFVNLYREPHPWFAASQWIYEQVEPGSTIVSEAWDDRLPDNVVFDGKRHLQSEYVTQDVNWLSGTGQEDGVDKLWDNLSMLAEADYVVLSSNRNYGVIPRLSASYPLSSQYYPLLFDGSLGFKVAYVGTRTPNLFGLHIKPDSFTWPGLEPPTAVSEYLQSLPGVNWGRFDESFTVYDQPLVIIFQNEGHLTAEQMADLFTVPPEVDLGSGDG